MLYQSCPTGSLHAHEELSQGPQAYTQSLLPFSSGCSSSQAYQISMHRGSSSLLWLLLHTPTAEGGAVQCSILQSTVLGEMAARSAHAAQCYRGACRELKLRQGPTLHGGAPAYVHELQQGGIPLNVIWHSLGGPGSLLVPHWYDAPGDAAHRACSPQLL